MRYIPTLMATIASFTALPALAQDKLEIVGAPEGGAMGFQPAATELASDLQWLDGMVLIIITAITVLVTALLIYAIFRFNRRVNPTPAKFTHNSPIEVAWTIIQIVILV